MRHLVNQAVSCPFPPSSILVTWSASHRSMVNCPRHQHTGAGDQDGRAVERGGNGMITVNDTNRTRDDADERLSLSGNHGSERKQGVREDHREIARGLWQSLVGLATLEGPNHKHPRFETVTLPCAQTTSCLAGTYSPTTKLTLPTPGACRAFRAISRSGTSLVTPVSWVQASPPEDPPADRDEASRPPREHSTETHPLHTGVVLAVEPNALRHLRTR